VKHWYVSVAVLIVGGVGILLRFFSDPIRDRPEYCVGSDIRMGISCNNVFTDDGSLFLVHSLSQMRVALRPW
jgi:hypothetical protein